MAKLLKLHEAIVIALINMDKETFTGTFIDIADYIQKEIYTLKPILVWQSKLCYGLRKQKELIHIFLNS